MLPHLVVETISGLEGELLMSEFSNVVGRWLLLLWILHLLYGLCVGVILFIEMSGADVFVIFFHRELLYHAAASQ